AVHPGYAIEAVTSPKGPVRQYLRRTNFGTGEIGVQWTDDRGPWRSRLFVSRAADVVVYEIFPPRKGEVRFRIDEDLEGLDRRDRDAWPQLKDDFRAQFAIEYARGDAKNEAWLTLRGHYNPERSAKGFEGVTRIVAQGGTVRVRDDEVRVRGASSIVVVTRLSRLEDYADSRLAEVQQDIEKLDADYDALLSDHAALHTAMYDRVRLDLNVGEARYLSVEALIRE
ncbi:MAG: hypothetical protein GY851_19585, partial [bacterium]|nr:hypothetical protein [bacterium]